MQERVYSPPHCSIPRRCNLNSTEEHIYDLLCQFHLIDHILFTSSAHCNTFILETNSQCCFHSGGQHLLHDELNMFRGWNLGGNMVLPVHKLNVDPFLLSHAIDRVKRWIHHVPNVDSASTSKNVICII